MTPARLPAIALGFYWIFSLTGQLFALPLTIVAAAVAISSHGFAVLIAIAAAVLLALTHFRNRAVARKFLEGVGSGATVPWHAGLAPFLTGGGKVKRVSDVAYGDAARNRLDVLTPAEPSRLPMPVLIHFHGGAWTAGNKDQQGKPLLHHMVARGWVGIDAAYRLGPVHRGPDWIVDALRTIAWVKANIADFGGDPERIVVTGGSAGGHLAALAALCHDDESFKPGFEAVNCWVAAAVPLYGRYDFLDRNRHLGRNHAAVIDQFMAKKVMPGPIVECESLWHAVSPLDRVRADAPPMLVVHGTGDTMLPWEDARTFAEALSAKSASPVELIALAGIQHGWDMASSAATWGHVRAIAHFLAFLENAPDNSRSG